MIEVAEAEVTDMSTCSTKGPNCQEEATIRSFWPGSEPALVCKGCAEVRQRISNAMGLMLHQEPIEPQVLASGESE